MKVEVPEEFNVFLENAVDALDSYKKQGKGIAEITEDMAKFQYYIRGRKDEMHDLASQSINGDTKEYLGNKIEALEKINKEVGAIYNVLLELVYDKTER